jgi:hypothetical protein
VCLSVFVLYCNTPENELTGEARAASNHLSIYLSIYLSCSAKTARVR